MKILFVLLASLVVLSSQAKAFPINLDGWDQISDKHFKIYFKRQSAGESPRQILNKAEEYYSTIADHIGYARYQNFWTWEERVPIVYFSSQEEFARTTNRPIWSKGFSVTHLASVNSRMIVTFKGQDDFLDSTLPHEISHLILHDFIGAQRSIPLWFDEGVAQLEEVKEDRHDQILARLVVSGQGISMDVLQGINSGSAFDSRSASIFYAESLYIVEFLVKTYGKEGFVNLCRDLRDGNPFEVALRRSYYPALDSLAKLQDEWIKHMKQYL